MGKPTEPATPLAKPKSWHMTVHYDSGGSRSVPLYQPTLKGATKYAALVIETYPHMQRATKLTIELK